MWDSSSFAIAERVSLRRGVGGLSLVEIRNRLGYTAQTTLHGAHVISWKNPSGTEQLYLSSRAVFAPGKAIRGGVPIIFPQFGPGPLPTHGFGRTREWKLIGSAEHRDQSVSITLALESDPETLTLWPHNFRAILTITLSDSLQFSLEVINTGSAPISFQCAFHSYFPVSHISQIQIAGLHEIPYLNNLRGRAQESGAPTPLLIDQEIDRVYLNAPNPTILEDLKRSSRMEITKQALSDVVVWNPWIDKSKTLQDLEPEAYLKFVCIEAGAIATPLVIESGDSKICGQQLRPLCTWSASS